MPSLPKPRLRRSGRVVASGTEPAADRTPQVEVVQGDGFRWVNIERPTPLETAWLAEQLERRPTEVIRKAVKGMLPKNKLASAQLTKLKVYAGPDHPHAAQAPKTLELAGGVLTEQS